MMKKLTKVQNLFLSLAVIAVVFSTVSCSYVPNQERVTKAAKKNLISKKATEDDMAFPSHDPSILAGKTVYAQSCAGCHGAKPHKHLGLQLMRSRTPEEQYLTITKGNMKGMPSFRDNLTRDERWDALMYIRAEILGYFVDGTQEFSNVSAIFGGNCAVCHGTRGHGDGPLHKNLDPLPANFNQYERIYTRSDSLLFNRISHGIPWTGMPAWKDRYDFDKKFSFDDELRWKLVRYVRQFGFSQGIDRLEKGRKKLEEFKQKVEANREGAK